MITVNDPTGWTKRRICFGAPHPGQRGTKGFTDPEGHIWEPVHFTPIGAKPPSAKTAKEDARRMKDQEKGGYQYVSLPWDGGTYLLNRYIHGTAMRIWDGLEPAPGTEWDMDEGWCPNQGYLPALWAPPNGGTPEWVTLYLRWRSWGIQPNRCLWTGNVLRYDSRNRRYGEMLGCPWSPNLLPTMVPADAPPVEPPTGGLFSFLSVSAPKPPEVGATEEQEVEAQRLILLKATDWLRERGADPAAWTGP